MPKNQIEQLDERVEVGGGATGESSVPTPTGDRAKAPGKSNSNGEPMQKGQNLAGTPIEDTDDENNTKPTGDMSAQNKASISTKPSAASASMKEDVEAMFAGQDLSEEFKEKATVIFEAAVASKVAELRTQIEEEVNAQYEERLSEAVDGLTEKVDEYLNYVVEQWMEQNQIAVEQSLRTEITEEFIDSLKELFVLHNIDLPDEKVDVVEQLAAELEETKEALNEAVDANIELSNILEEHAKQQIFGEVAEGLADTQVEKLATLAEGVQFEDVDSYKAKLEVVKEQFFAANKKPVKPAVLNEEVDPVEEVQAPSDTVAAYVSAISRTVKK